MTENPIDFANFPNPFYDRLIADISVSDAQVVYLQLIDNYGKVIRRKQFAVTGGSNRLELDNMQALPSGMYIAQLQSANRIINKKVMKQ